MPFPGRTWEREQARAMPVPGSTWEREKREQCRSQVEPESESGRNFPYSNRLLALILFLVAWFYRATLIARLWLDAEAESLTQTEMESEKFIGHLG
jgi:hypothetical protein